MKRLLLLSMFSSLMSSHGNGLIAGPQIHIVSIDNQTGEEIALYIYNHKDRDKKLLKGGPIFVASAPRRTRAQSVKKPIFALESHLVVNNATKTGEALFDALGLSVVTPKYTFEADIQNPDLYIRLRSLTFTPGSKKLAIVETLMRKNSSEQSTRPATENIDINDIIIGKLTIRPSSDGINYSLELTTDYKRFFQGDF